ncbi:McrB family protein [Bacillus sp. D386]|uniref:McrB family protein n=1 Tax=Bacillus sp. D386 TaxID=2587155 RepID=UPI00111EC305|nr:hypothetical protein [Bacillus sp. D386]
MTETKWFETKFLGKLQDTDHFLLTKENSIIRFPIKVISNPPENITDDITKRVTSFSGELENLGFTDDKDLTPEERYKELTDFLNVHYLMFKIKAKYKENDQTFYNAYDLEVVRRESNNDHTYFPIPFIRTNSGKKTVDVIQKLTNNEYVQSYFSLSKESEDYPSFVLIGEYKSSLVKEPFSEPKLDRLYAFGPIEGIEYSEEYQFKFITNKENTYYREISLKELGEYYLSKGKVMFVTGEKDNEIRESLISKGRKVSPQKAKSKIEDINELEFLKVFEEVALSKNQLYTPLDLYNFHTAMKNKSLVILAGLSGTGKSRIVQCYHEALNKFASKGSDYSNVNKSKLLFVPVRPFWQDDTDLLGYLDSSQGIYRPGESGLVDFIIEANNNPDECYIVCLDEMNLAKVEHYFSQFLSVLEREPDDRHINLYSSNLNGRVYNQNVYPSEIKLSENLLFAGTVNIDESSFQFSDKVLDRANTISLGLCPYKDVREKLATALNEKKESPKGEVETVEPLRTFIKLKSMQKNHKYSVLTAEEIDILWEINRLMQEATDQIGVGYRIVNQIEEYIANIPNSPQFPRSKAFDLQLTQRILPKLRGSQKQLGALIGKIQNEKYEEGHLYKLLNNNRSISDFDSAKRKLVNLAKELDEYGHTI